MQYTLAIQTANGTTASAASLVSLGSTVAYAAGSGVAIVDTAQQDDFSFRVCAPKQLKSRVPTTQLGSMNAESKASLRLNQISCIALSERYVALGETGYCPRVVIFHRSSSAILATIQEHQFGVHLMQFSPSGDLLATLGTPNDGYIYVWNTGAKVSIRVSNRCISEVNSLIWLSETTLVTAGVRHLRVWIVADGTVLTGRNIVLGELANSRFTSLLRINDTEFYVANEIGQIFTVGNGQLELYNETGERVQSLATAEPNLIAAGPALIQYYQEKNLLKTEDQPSKAVISVANSIVYLESGSIAHLNGTSISGTCFTGVAPSSSGFVAWNSSVLAYFDRGGLEMSREPLESLPLAICLGERNELVQAYDNGTVTINNKEFVAHSVEGSAISLHAKSGWVVSAGRDHLQIYQTSPEPKQWQTLGMHGRVSKAKVVEHNTIIATVTNKVINIIKADENQTFRVYKSIPCSSPIQDFMVHDSQLYVSTLDKKLTTYDLEGVQIESIPTLDMLGDPVVITSLGVMEHEQHTLIIGGASDKSLVLYERGELVACRWAHSEVPRVLVVGSLVVSVASDGMFIYRLVQEYESPVRPSSPVKIARSPSPLRRPRTIVRSPERVERAESPVRVEPSGRPKSPIRRTKSPVVRESLRLAPPKFSLEPALGTEAPSTLVTQLQQYIESNKPDPSLFKLLTQALEKDPQALGYYARKLADHFAT